MKEIDLSTMSLDELKSLQTKVNKAIETYEERKRKEAIAAVEAKAREMGFSLNELYATQQKKPRGARPPKYRHPENPNLTWSGRGRQPGWYKELVEAGTDPEDLKISA